MIAGIDLMKRRTEPRWASVVLWVMPRPLFVFTVLFALFIAALIFGLFAIAEQWKVGWIWCTMSLSLGVIIAAATVTRLWYARLAPMAYPKQASAPQVPTLAIFSLLLSTASGGVTLLTTLPQQFPGAIRVVGVKYFVTLALTVASSAYFAMFGRQAILKHYHALSEPHSLTASQVFWVVFYLAILVAYARWVIP
jgi:hypothetical protein